MPWEYLLSGATGAGVVAVAFFLFLSKFIESGVSSVLQAKLEQAKAEMARENDRLKSELDVLGTLRKNLTAAVWKAHEDTVKSMAAVLATVQEPFALLEFEAMSGILNNPQERSRVTQELANALTAYRKLNHESVHLISDHAGDIAQAFFDASYHLYLFLTGMASTETTQPEGVKNLTELESAISALLPGSENATQISSDLAAHSTAYQFTAHLQKMKDQRKLFYGHMSEVFGVSRALPWMTPGATAAGNAPAALDPLGHRQGRKGEA